jgi:glycosyltransferase involved in cell wall biosynthesis
VHVIVPDGIDDASTPSGGNAYDRHICTGLRANGWTVHEHPAAGNWPTPDARARAALAGALDSVPDGAAVLLDGLVACGVPEVVEPRAGRLRMVVLVHLPLGDEVGAAPGLDELERRTLRAVRAVVATSAWAAARVIARHGLTAERVRVATPGVEPADPAPGTDGASRLLCVGSISRTKGQDLLVEALGAVAGSASAATAVAGRPGAVTARPGAVTDRSWRCDLVGSLHRDPEHVAGVRRAIERHGLDECVRLTGPLTGEPLSAAFADADLLVLPSRAETYGMVVTEALARGIPVLAAAVGGVPATLGRAPDGEVPGLLVPPADAPALAWALRRWFDEPELRNGLRAAAGRRREALPGWEVTSRCLARVLNQLS